MERRTFLGLAGLSLCSGLVEPAACFADSSEETAAYGSGHFGDWITDSFGLPAYRYTCNQIKDPKAFSAVDKAWRAATDHPHQVGNDRIVAVASNYGYVQVRQDEGSPKFLNDYSPDDGRYGGGIGFLADESDLLSTYYTGAADSFDRVFGMGYLRKKVTGHKYAIDQVIFAPFGDDPVMVSQVTITNRTEHVARPRWIEYWGCHHYQFSYRSFMEAAVLGDATASPKLRRAFADRFKHRFQAIKAGRGLIETQTFQGRSPEEEDSWLKVQAALAANPNNFFGGPVPPLPPAANMDDLHPPATFLVSLDAPCDGFTTDGASFFRGGIENAQGPARVLDNDLTTSGPGSALLLARNLILQPGESRTLYFLYGYLPAGFDLDTLVTRYEQDYASAWARSSAHWNQAGLRLKTQAEPWVERETAWSSYYLRSALTYDSYFHEHILSQGAPYQYIAGLQGAARDPLQHALPLVFSDPGIVRQVLRYTLKEMQPDGSLPYGVVGNGVPMPCRYRPSDLELWLLWLASEYVLATRDTKFLDETLTGATDATTVRALLARAYLRITTVIGVGKHDLMRLLNGDWNDSIVVNRLPPPQVAEVLRQGESVLNAAMAAYVLAYYARMLEFVGSTAPASEASAKAEAQKQAVRGQWAGQWFRRAWLGETLGWSGEKQMWLEPQPWAMISGSATPEQAATLVTSIDTFARRSSPLGAPLQSQPDQTMKDDSGVGTNGGIFAAINGTLIWALALNNGEMAWDEWKKNTLARHAAVYPDLWFGIWSGPDAYNSIHSRDPGGTGLDFPVLNMHSHTWPLYSSTKLLGLEFHSDGLRFHPTIPLSQYEFSSPLVGFEKTSRGYSGWYAPTIAGRWSIRIRLPHADLVRMKQVQINGVNHVLQPTEQGVQFSGQSQPAKPLRWRLI
jgi:Glycosyl hydrolase 36 superfamily, catalytic domain